MAPRTGVRFTYGSTEDLAKSRLLGDTASHASDTARVSGSPHDSSWMFRGDVITERNQGGRWIKVAVVSALALGAVTMAVRSSSSRPPERPGESSTGNFAAVGVNARTTRNGPSVRPRVDAAPPLAFSALNFYHIRDGKPAQDYPWLKNTKLIEPHRETTLSVQDPRPGHDYSWEIRDAADGDEVHASVSGAEAIVILTKLDENVITLRETDADGAETRRLDEPVMVKYVRREIRTLTDDEREELLDAMHKLWAVRVQDGNGREIYGDGYSDIWAINRLHYKAASPQECDHFHDGLGFLVNHALLSNTFEYSLQAVNPKLTLPYWDFTIETSTAGTDGTEEVPDLFQSQTKTPLLQSSWFGTHDSDDNMVKDGRWAFTPIPRMKENNPSGIEPDVYSKLRAPWNVNDRAYLTRGLGKLCHAHVEESYPWPTCKMHYDLATSYDDFYSWVWGSLYDPHGPVHIWIGGVVDCEETYEKISALVGEEIAEEMALLSFVHRKNLFRDGFFSCEGSVDVSEKPDDVLSSGMCGCHGFDLTQGDDYKTIFGTLAFMEEYAGDADEDVKRQLVALLCSSTVNDGDHLQASSSLDPSFWSTHPTMERLWMFSVLTGQVTEFNWPDSDIAYTGSDGTTYTELVSIYSDSCEGHRGSDVFPYQLLAQDANDFTVRTGIKGNPEEGGNTFTNREALAAFDPRLNALPYVYDTFKWLHCAEDGIYMDDAWATDTAKVGAEVTTPSKLTKAPGERETAAGRTIFEKDSPKYPMYGSLKRKMAHLKARKGAKP